MMNVWIRNLSKEQDYGYGSENQDISMPSVLNEIKKIGESVERIMTR